LYLRAAEGEFLKWCS